MSHTLIIAEAGVNHNGSLKNALALVDAAADAGADIVKFQTFKAEKLVSATAPLANYQKHNLSEQGNNAVDSQYKMLKALELSVDDHNEIIKRCRQCGIQFLSTAFDLDSIEFLASLSPQYWKIPSGEITNFPYLRAIAQHGGKIILSSGMCTIDDIDSALSTLRRFGAKLSDISLLHCNTEYPTPMCDVNLNVIPQLYHKYGITVGYSDHTQGIEVPIAAVALGAKIIEKHLTLDKSLDGPDQKASLEPSEFKQMVTAIRNIEQALGSGEKQVTPSELKNIAVARKSIVANKDIRQGEVITEDMLTTKRPATGLSPMLWEQVIGSKAIRNFHTDELLEI